MSFGSMPADSKLSPSFCWITVMVIALGWALSACEVSAQTIRDTVSLQCVACHAGMDRFAQDPETGKIKDIAIDMERFHRADHGQTDCLDCHTEGFDLFPHFRKKTLVCMSCHPRRDDGATDDEPYEFHRIQEEFEATPHYTEYQWEKEKCCGTGNGDDTVATGQTNGQREDKEKFTCEHCHNPHYFEATARLETARRILDNDNQPCLRCHEDEATVMLADPVEQGLIPVHGYLPHMELHLRTTRCVDCHTNVRVAVAHDLPSGKNADQGCNSCHSLESVLMGRLYRYQSEPERTLGFHNATMLPDSYIMGAHRHRVADWLTYILMGCSVLLIALYGGVRIQHRLQRSRPAKHHADRSVSNGKS